MKKLVFFVIIGVSISAISRESRSFGNELVYVSDGADLSTVLMQENKRFIIQHSHDLEGKNIVIPFWIFKEGRFEVEVLSVMVALSRGGYYLIM